jgi:hypothetical protein
VRIEATTGRSWWWERLEGGCGRLPAGVPSLRGRPSGARGQRALPRIGRGRLWLLDLLPLGAATGWHYLGIGIVSCVLLRHPASAVRHQDQSREPAWARALETRAAWLRTFLSDGKFTGLGTASLEVEVEAGNLAFCKQAP